MILTGLAMTTAFADDSTGQTNNTSPAMEAQPQSGTMDQNNANANMSGTANGSMGVSGASSSDGYQK